MSVGYTASIGSRFNIFANVFKDYDQRQTVGAFIGVTVSLGNNVSVGTNASSYDGRKSVSVTANRPVDYDKGGFGWNVQKPMPAAKAIARAGRADHRGRYGERRRRPQHIHSGNIESNHVHACGAGSLVVADGAVLAGRSIYDAFAAECRPTACPMCRSCARTAWWARPMPVAACSCPTCCLRWGTGSPSVPSGCRPRPA